MSRSARRSGVSPSPPASMSWPGSLTSRPRIPGTRSSRVGLRMAEHYSFLGWWTPTELEQDRHLNRWEAKALISLGAELWHASLGNREDVLRRAIACFEATLRVYTEVQSPQDWGKAQ